MNSTFLIDNFITIFPIKKYKFPFSANWSSSNQQIKRTESLFTVTPDQKAKFCRLLSGFNGIEINPILSFGKAALLGYSSKGNAGTCMYAYPECPRDPERLVEYLNNYNGGFFRFFNGLNPQHLNKQPYGLAPEQNFGRPPYLHSFQSGIYSTEDFIFM